MGILSIQSHVAYGYVGNKAAVYPLQSMGYDVWPVNTVQFSNHTGYGEWRGEVFDRGHIRDVIDGVEARAGMRTRAILSGYMGSQDICHEVADTIKRMKSRNNNIIYLCDPVIDTTSCKVKPEVVAFFKASLRADIVTPNQFEVGVLTGCDTSDIEGLQQAVQLLRKSGIGTVVVTGVRVRELDGLFVFVDFDGGSYLVKTHQYEFDVAPNGTGDLFSAVFLGEYLKEYDALSALRHAVYWLDFVVARTHAARSRELCIVGINYGDASSIMLPEAIELSAMDVS